MKGSGQEASGIAEVDWKSPLDKRPENKRGKLPSGCGLISHARGHGEQKIVGHHKWLKDVP